MSQPLTVKEFMRLLSKADSHAVVEVFDGYSPSKVYEIRGATLMTHSKLRLNKNDEVVRIDKTTDK